MKSFILLSTVQTISGTVYPNLPKGWTATSESGGWYTVQRDNNADRFYHFKLMIDGADVLQPTKGVFAVCGERADLKEAWDWAKARSLDVWTIHQLRSDISSKANAIRNAWKEHHSGSTRTELASTIAGFTYAQASEDTVSESDLEEPIE
ncbi:MAG: hypothetical protein RLP09_02630 [Sandaracinaceae bacterium]